MHWISWQTTVGNSGGGPSDCRGLIYLGYWILPKTNSRGVLKISLLKLKLHVYIRCHLSDFIRGHCNFGKSKSSLLLYKSFDMQKSHSTTSLNLEHWIGGCVKFASLCKTIIDTTEGSLRTHLDNLQTQDIWSSVPRATWTMNGIFPILQLTVVQVVADSISTIHCINRKRAPTLPPLQKTIKL